MLFISLLFMILFFAWLSREILEAILAPLFDHIPFLAQFKWMQIYIAMGVAVGLAFFYQLDIIFVIGGYINIDWPPFTEVTWVGEVITGAVVGLGANFVHLLIEFVVEQWDWLRNILKKDEGAE